MSQNTCVLQRVTWRNILNQFMRKKNHLNVNFVTIDISTEGPSARNWWARQTSVLFFNEICQKWIDELRAYQFIICVKHHVFISELYARILHAWCIAYRFWNCEVLGWHPNTLSILFSKFLRSQNSKTLQIRGQIFETFLNSLSSTTQNKINSNWNKNCPKRTSLMKHTIFTNPYKLGPIDLFLPCYRFGMNKYQNKIPIVSRILFIVNSDVNK